jgi:hypothetical protein
MEAAVERAGAPRRGEPAARAPSPQATATITAGHASLPAASSGDGETERGGREEDGGLVLHSVRNYLRGTCSWPGIFQAGAHATYVLLLVQVRWLHSHHSLENHPLHLSLAWCPVQQYPKIKCSESGAV